MSDAKIVKKNELLGSESAAIGTISKFLFVIPNVAKSTTGEETRLRMGGVGGLVKFNVSCLSEDFDISIRNRAGVDAGSINEVYTKTGVNKSYREEITGGLTISLENEDSPVQPYSYIVIKNDDSSNDSGPIILEMYVRPL